MEVLLGPDGCDAVPDGLGHELKAIIRADIGRPLILKRSLRISLTSVALRLRFTRIANHSEGIHQCDDKCCSRMRSVGPFAVWEGFTK